MRFLIALAIASISVSASAQTNPDRAPTRSRDCLRGQEVGIPFPSSSRPDATYMFVTTVMFERADGQYGSVVGWQTKHTFVQACTAAQTDANLELASQDATITGVTAMLVPDSVLKRGAAH